MARTCFDFGSVAKSVGSSLRFFKCSLISMGSRSLSNQDVFGGHWLVWWHEPLCAEAAGFCIQSLQGFLQVTQDSMLAASVHGENGILDQTVLARGRRFGTLIPDKITQSVRALGFCWAALAASCEWGVQSWWWSSTDGKGLQWPMHHWMVGIWTFGGIGSLVDTFLLCRSSCLFLRHQLLL